MRRRTIDYQDDEYDVVVVLGRASVLQGAQRAVILGLQYARFRTVSEDDPISLEERAVATITYPACLSCIVSIENREPKKSKLADGVIEEKPKKAVVRKKLVEDISLADFLMLPDALVQQWERYAYELNPQWVPQGEAQGDEEGEVKESSSSSG